MRVIIAGSRSINNIALVELACYRAIQKWRRDGISSYITEVVCGEAKGVDLLGKILAAKANIPIKSFPADWEKYGKRAGYIRNEEMANYAEALIAVWDGKSSGTKMMIDIARKKGLKVFVFNAATTIEKDAIYDNET